MTKNGLRIPCPCTECQGEEKDWRTVATHLDRDRASRPLFPEVHLAPPRRLQPPLVLQAPPVAADLPPDDPLQGVDPPRPQQEDHKSEFVSHVENMDNWEEPAYTTVNNALSLN